MPLETKTLSEITKLEEEVFALEDQLESAQQTLSDLVCDRIDVPDKLERMEGMALSLVEHLGGALGGHSDYLSLLSTYRSNRAVAVDLLSEAYTPIGILRCGRGCELLGDVEVRTKRILEDMREAISLYCDFDSLRGVLGEDVQAARNLLDSVHHLIKEITA